MLPYVVPSATACQDRCEREPDCTAWFYVTEPSVITIGSSLYNQTLPIPIDFCFISPRCPFAPAGAVGPGNDRNMQLRTRGAALYVHFDDVAELGSLGRIGGNCDATFPDMQVGQR